MNLPNLPTDNLYKFVALSGLVIYAFSIVYPIYLMKTYSELAHETRTEIAKIEIESDRLVQSTDELSKRLEKIKESYNLDEVEAPKFGAEDMDELKEKSKDPEFRAYIEFFRKNRHYLIPNLEALEEVGRLNLEMEEKHYMHQLNIVDFKELNARLDELERQISVVNIISKVGNALGAIMVAAGFFLWYTRVQRVLDLKLEAELLSVSDELNSANKTE